MNLLRLPSEVQFLVKGLVVIVAVTAGDISSQVSDFRALKREQAMARKVADSAKKGVHKIKERAGRYAGTHRVKSETKKKRIRGR